MNEKTIITLAGVAIIFSGLLMQFSNQDQPTGILMAAFGLLIIGASQWTKKESNAKKRKQST